MKRYIILLVALTLFACSDSEKEIKKQESLTVSANGEYDLGKGMYIKTRQVEDTRRPIGSKLSWQGDAKLRLQIYTGKRTIDTVLSTVFPNEVVVDGIQIKLNSLYPYPELDKPRNQTDYSIQLQINKPK